MENTFSDLKDRELFDQIFADFRTHMLMRGCSDKTVNDRELVIMAAARDTGESPLELKAQSLGNWLASKQTPKTIATYHSHLSAWHHFLVRWNWRPDNPMELIDAPRAKSKPVEAISREELELVLESNLSVVNRQRILIAAFTGLRVSEIGRIRGEDYNPIKKTLRVVGKGSRVDIVPVHQLFVELAKQMPRKGYWFPSASDAGHVQGKTISRAIKEAFARVGVSMNAHQLRHFFATELISSGADSSVVQILMRHASLATTAIYIHINQSLQREALSQLPAPMSEVAGQTSPLLHVAADSHDERSTQ